MQGGPRFASGPPGRWPVSGAVCATCSVIAPLQRCWGRGPEREGPLTWLEPPLPSGPCPGIALGTSQLGRGPSWCLPPTPMFPGREQGWAGRQSRPLTLGTWSVPLPDFSLPPPPTQGCQSGQGTGLGWPVLQQGDCVPRAASPVTGRLPGMGTPPPCAPACPQKGTWSHARYGLPWAPGVPRLPHADDSARTVLSQICVGRVGAAPAWGSEDRPDGGLTRWVEAAPPGAAILAVFLAEGPGSGRSLPHEGSSNRANGWDPPVLRPGLGVGPVPGGGACSALLPLTPAWALLPCLQPRSAAPRAGPGPAGGWGGQGPRPQGREGLWKPVQPGGSRDAVLLFSFAR